MSEVPVTVSTSSESRSPTIPALKKKTQHLVWGSSVLFIHSFKCYQDFFNFLYASKQIVSTTTSLFLLPSS